VANALAAASSTSICTVRCGNNAERKNNQ